MKGLLLLSGKPIDGHGGVPIFRVMRQSSLRVAEVEAVEFHWSFVCRNEPLLNNLGSCPLSRTMRSTMTSRNALAVV